VSASRRELFFLAIGSAVVFGLRVHMAPWASFVPLAVGLASARQVIGDAAPAIEGRAGRGSIYVFTNR